MVRFSSGLGESCTAGRLKMRDTRVPSQLQVGCHAAHHNQRGYGDVLVVHIVQSILEPVLHVGEGDVLEVRAQLVRDILRQGLRGEEKRERGKGDCQRQKERSE